MDIPHKLIWEAHEHVHTEKHPDWFWMVSIVIATIAILSIYFHNYLFAIIILVGGFTAAMHAHIHPRLIQYEINSRGIIIDSSMYQYLTLDSFWINEHERTLLIKSKKFFMTLIIIQLDDMDTEVMREYLLQHLEEEEHTEPVLQKFMEYVGF